MYYDDDYQCIDYEYEDFRESTGHITNLDPAQETLYNAAIALYKQDVYAEADMWVGDGYKWSNCKGFYVLAPMGDLGPFWRIFEKIQANSQKEQHNAPQS